jgi:hypothetical protein
MTQLLQAAKNIVEAAFHAIFKHKLQCSSHIMPLHCQVTVPLPTTLKGKGKKTILNVAQI